MKKRVGFTLCLSVFGALCGWTVARALTRKREKVADRIFLEQKIEVLESEGGIVLG